MKNICVFCGSKHGIRPQYSDNARLLAHTLVKHKIGLVYGGTPDISTANNGASAPRKERSNSHLEHLSYRWHSGPDGRDSKNGKQSQCSTVKPGQHQLWCNSWHSFLVIATMSFSKLHCTINKISAACLLPSSCFRPPFQQLPN